MAGRMTNEITGVITGILKVVVHPFHMGGNPTDASFEEGKLEILVTIQEAGTQDAGEAGHDGKYARQHPIRKMVLKKFVDQRKLEAKVNGRQWADSNDPLRQKTDRGRDDRAVSHRPCR